MILYCPSHPGNRVPPAMLLPRDLPMNKPVPYPEGAVQGLFSQRNSMSVCYAAFVPELHYDDDDENYVGGLFWDSRSPSLQDQAGIPLLESCGNGK